jgi:hypothetical protein
VIEAYGVPLALYTDWKNVYVREANAEEQVTEAVPLTQFGRMCAALGIQIIAANSPQAKGRVEQNHGTHQGSLVKKLRRFAQPFASSEDLPRGTPSRATLDRVLQLEETRVLSNDWVVRYDTRYLQVARQSQQAPARSTVLVRKATTGAIEIRYRGRLMPWTEIPAPAPKSPAPRPRQVAAPGRSARSRPGADHPWRHEPVGRAQRTVEVPGRP